MKLEKGIITNTQLMFLIISFMEFMVLAINFVYPISKESTWIAILVAYALVILIALGYTAIAKKYPGKNLVEINDIALGPFIGKIFSALYIWFFFEYLIHFSYYFNSFWITYIMTETPRIVFVVFLMAVCAMAVKDGIETIARCSVIFAILVGTMVISIVVAQISKMELSHFLPILDMTPKVFIQSVHIILTIPFCDIVVFLMILPYTDKNTQIRKPVLLAISLSTALMFICVLASTAVLGVRMGTSTSGTFAATREIEIAAILARVDVLIAITLLITIFIKITVFYYATVLGLAQMLKLRSYKPLIVPIGLIACAISANLYPSDMEQVYCAQYIWPFNASIFEILLPAITLVVIALQSVWKEKGAAE